MDKSQELESGLPITHKQFDVLNGIIPNEISDKDSIILDLDDQLRYNDSIRKDKDQEREQNRKDKDLDFKQKRDQVIDYAAVFIICAAALTAMYILVQDPKQSNKDWQGILTTITAVAGGYLFGGGKKNI
jgi:hypothetical protein